MGKAKSWALDLGANVSEGSVHFRVWAPKASSVLLVIVGEKEPIPMNAEGRVYFSIFIEGLGPKRRYGYLLSEDRPRPDPVSRFQAEGIHDSSEVVDPSQFSIPLKDGGNFSP
jgi:maltooligosyltrehalose trehalohydrolase